MRPVALARAARAFSLRTTLILALAACGGGGDGPGATDPPAPPPPPPPAPVATVTVTPGTVSLMPQATSQLNVATADASGNSLSGRTVTWTSEPATVATVSTTGLVTAVAPGTATVTATSEGKTGTATVTVLHPVATVTLDKTASSFVPAQTLQLTATLKATTGDVLSNRAIAWTTSAASVATVSTTGLVTAVNPGDATITATSEGKTATFAATVMQGGVVIANATTTITNSDSSVSLSIPAGAAPNGLTISIDPTTTVPSPLPTAAWKMGTTLYKLGPDGTQFSSPVTVTLKYDPAKMPQWVIPGDLRIHRWNGTAWNTLANVTIDTAKKTISGTTTGFSTFTLTAGLPPAQLNPIPAQVNYNQRSVNFTAGVPGHVANAFQYRWVTTGANGSLGANFGAQQQYIASVPILPQGVIDLVGVEVSAQQVPNGPFVPIATAQTGIDSNLGLTFELNPWSQEADFGQKKTVQAVVRNRDGSIYTSPDLNYDYTATSYAGNTTPASGRTTVATATYQAFPIQQQLKKAPRVDKISVAFTLREHVWSGDVFGNRSVTYNFRNLGTADAFVEVGKDTYVGNFQVITVPTPAAACVYAYIYVPKVTPAPKSYAIKAYGFNDNGGYGTSYTRTFTGATGGALTDVQDVGTDFRVGLDGGCSTTQNGVTFRQGLYASRFQGIQVEVKVVP